MDENVLRARLRRLADIEPPVAVDRAGVLRAGRRRRVGRTVGTGAAALALVAGIFPAVQALGPDRAAVLPAGPTSTLGSLPSPRAVVDHAAGTVTLSGDPLLDRGPAAVMATAAAHFRSVCMAERGFGEQWAFDGPVDRRPPTLHERAPYGVWREVDVRASGYGHAVQVYPREMGEAETDAYRRCDTDLARAGLGIAAEGTQDVEAQEDPGAWSFALGTAEGRALRAEWSRCLAEAGVAAGPDETSMIPHGILQAPFDEQVRVGLVDVACKERLDLVQRMADLDAALLAPHLERVRQEATRTGTLQGPILERATAYLAEQGIVMPEPSPVPTSAG